MTKAKDSKASKKKAGSALVSMKDLEGAYAADAKAEADTEPLDSGNNIRTRGKKFKVGEESLKEPLSTVVLGTSMVNAYYEGDFDQDNPSNPVCAAVGEVGKEDLMAPPEGTFKPQSTSCKTCPKGQFGSADKGRGKACKNSRRVVLIGSGDERAEPQVLSLNIPPTGLRKFSAYVKRVAAACSRPLHGVITAFTFDEEQDWPCPVPALVKPIDDVGLAQRALTARGEGGKNIKALLMKPVDTAPRAESEGKKPAAKGKAGAKKRKF